MADATANTGWAAAIMILAAVTVPGPGNVRRVAWRALIWMGGIGTSTVTGRHDQNKKKNLPLGGIWW